ncbi:MAG TPA: hypothetical protein VF773_15905 [Verrucomicrobiae bacterium]
MKQPRPKQQLPAEIVADVQSAIRNQFYGDALDRWPKDQHFIKREFTLYFASWLDKRGVSLPPHQYKQILLERLNEIKVHGNTRAIKYWPGYLKHVLQEHLKHHGEEIYEQAKSLRTLAENTLLSLGKAATDGSPDPVAAMAAARRDLLQARSAKRPSKTKTTQLDLL